FIVTTLSSLRPTLYIIVPPTLLYFLLFFFNYTSTTEIYTLSLHDALPISTLLYFASNRAGGPGMNDIYVSTLQADGTFGSAAAVAELNTPSQDQQPAIRRDGLELFLGSDRTGTVGSIDLWVSTRASTTDPWSPPVNV